jgi:hypothetical protein
MEEAPEVSLRGFPAAQSFRCAQGTHQKTLCCDDSLLQARLGNEAQHNQGSPAYPEAAAYAGSDTHEKLLWTGFRKKLKRLWDGGNSPSKP